MLNINVSKKCRVCGKPLERHLCLKCFGAGEIGQGLLNKRACKACAGTGWVYTCPDQKKHPPAQKTIGGIAGTSTGAGMLKPQRKRCPTCQGTKGIRHPFTGQAGPCPTCGGTGYV